MSTFEALKLITDKQLEENDQLETDLMKLKQLHKEYQNYDDQSTKMFDNVHILNQAQVAVSKHQSDEIRPDSNPTSTENAADPDQFEPLSTLLFHKMLHLPLVDMKAKHLRKPEKKWFEFILQQIFFITVGKKQNKRKYKGAWFSSIIR